MAHEMGYRLEKAGLKFVYNPLAIGYHHHIKDFKQFCIDQEKAGESLIQIFKKYPEIESPKKIDLLNKHFGELPFKKMIMKLIMTLTMRIPALLIFPKLLIKEFEDSYSKKNILFPCYRLIAYYHYALGMQRGLLNFRGKQ